MNREQIIKALECCLAPKNMCEKCPIQEECISHPLDAILAKYALSLIKELTEENERLRADTVRKMHDMIKERCIEGGIYPAFVARTIEKVAKELLEESHDDT